MPNASKIEELLFRAIGSSEIGKATALSVAEQMYPRLLEPQESQEMAMSLSLAGLRFETAAIACRDAMRELLPTVAAEFAGHAPSGGLTVTRLSEAALDLYKACHQAFHAFQDGWAIDWGDLVRALQKANPQYDPKVAGDPNAT